jgi:cation diffusion facilitator CzcD-associated flavoprotein CzcO
VRPSDIVIGAGPAGLAVGACLSRTNIPYTILDRGQNVAATWRRHYDRLHLHTNMGIGNSGAEIALDLHEHRAYPTIAVRSPVNVLPRDVLGVPVAVTARVAGLLPPTVADTIARFSVSTRARDI